MQISNVQMKKERGWWFDWQIFIPFLHGFLCFTNQSPAHLKSAHL